MIYVTGDTHGDIDAGKLSVRRFPEQKSLTREDYLIILGDFGAVWHGGPKDNYLLKWHEQKPYTTLFIGGNHENYQALSAFPVEKWNGGRVRRVRPHVLQLLNGQVFTLEGRRFFVMGGATSTDKDSRREGVSWWPGEEPDDVDYAEAEQNLSALGYEVDIVLTHTIPKGAYTKILSGRPDTGSRVEAYLDGLAGKLAYRRWYAGHMHQDRVVEDMRLRLMYDDIEEITV